MLNKFNEVGKKYGRLTVICRAENYKNGSSQWYCRCDCGNLELIKVRASNLRSGHTKSCGCLIVETTKKTHSNKILSEDTKEKISKSNSGARENSLSDIGKKYPYRGKYKRGSLVVRKVNNIIKSAKDRGLDVLISKEKIADMIVSPCFYCGRKSILEGYKTSNGVDRIDNSKGYIEENCVSCCFFCNVCKNDRTIDEFREHIINIYNNFIKEYKDGD